MVIHYAQNYFSCPRYFVAAGEELPLESESFDYIQIISTLEHVTDPGLVVREAYRVLKNGGYLYIVVHKRNLDLLIIFSAYSLVKMLLRIVFKEDGQADASNYSLPLPLVKDEISKSVKEVNLKMIEKGDLVSYINVSFYRKLHLPISFLLRIANVANNSGISVFKNLEYRVYQK